MVRSTRSKMKPEPAEGMTTVAIPGIDNEAPIEPGSTLRQADSITGPMDVVNGVNNQAPTQDAMYSLGEQCRQLIQAIQKLASLRIDTTLPSLPKFVVVGDQSHGKSSIIEAVCDINLPRSTGTCTRCPFRITTTASDGPPEWTCKISLELSWSYGADHYPQETASANNKIGRWTDTGKPDVIPIATTKDKAELERLLCLAQAAILNPGIPANEILRGRAVGDGVQFSPNIIALEISAPELSEISLFDLPGTISAVSNHTADSVHLVKFVEQLIEYYIQQENTLVLLAASATQDFECSRAFGLIQTCRAQDRTMGVLTKPDLIEESKLERVELVLKGESFQLGQGWYVTKHSSQAEINKGVSHAQARVWERMFFQGEPWSTAWAALSDRFGTDRLRYAIATLLKEHIMNCLPEIAARIEARLHNVKEELNAIPPQSKEPCLTVTLAIDKLVTPIVEQLKGESLNNRFRKRYHEHFNDLGSKLASARPRVVLGSPIELSDSEDDDADSVPLPQRPAKARKGINGNSIGTQARNNTPSPAGRKAIKKENGTPGASVKYETYTLEGIRRAFINGRTSTIREEPIRVTLDLMKRNQAGWPAAVDLTIKEIGSSVTKVLQESLEHNLRGRGETKLYRETKKVLVEFYKVLMEDASTHIRDYMICEGHMPIHYPDTALEEKQQAIEKGLKEEREELRTDEEIDKMGVRPEDRKKKNVDEARAKLALHPDPYASTITSIAKIIAYYDHASAGIPELVAKVFEYKLIHALQTKLKGRLEEGLQSKNSEYCAELLAEDPARLQQRRELEAEQAKLTAALEEVRARSLLV